MIVIAHGIIQLHFRHKEKLARLIRSQSVLRLRWNLCESIGGNCNLNCSRRTKGASDASQSLDATVKVKIEITFHFEVECSIYFFSDS